MTQVNWATLAYNLVQVVNLLVVYNLPYISLVVWVKKNSNKVGIEKKPIVYYILFLVAILLLHSTLLLVFRIDSCRDEPVRHCLQIIVVLVLNALKLAMCLAMMLVTLRIPAQEISQIKLSHTKSRSLIGDVTISGSSKEYSQIQLEDQQPFFTLRIDKKQQISHDDKFCHAVNYCYRETVDDRVLRDFETTNSSAANQELADDLDERLLTGLAQSDTRVIRRQMLKTEAELVSLARDLLRLSRKDRTRSVFSDAAQTELDLGDLEDLVNGLMNNLKSSIVHDDFVEKGCQLVADFLQIDWTGVADGVWLKGFSLCSEFRLTFLLTQAQFAELFPNFLVEHVRAANDSRLRLEVLLKREDRRVAVDKSLGQIEALANDVFPGLDLPADTKHFCFHKDLTYLLNVCLNEHPRQSRVLRFLGLDEVRVYSIQTKAPRITLDIESFYGREDRHVQYRLTFEFGFMDRDIKTVVRSKRHFMLLSKNLSRRFGSKYALRKTGYGDMGYVKSWLEKLFQRLEIWRSSEFRIFVGYFERDILTVG